MSYPVKKPVGRSAGWSQSRVLTETKTGSPLAALSFSADSLERGLSEAHARTATSTPVTDIHFMVARQGSIKAGIQGMIDANPVLVIATSTCPFCLEAKRTLAAHGITGTFLDIDRSSYRRSGRGFSTGGLVSNCDGLRRKFESKEPNYAAIRKAMTSLAANRTSVPQIWINKKYIGGCDDLKALDVTGDLGVALEGVPRAATLADGESAPDTDKSPANSAVSTYPGPTAAYFSMFHAPISVDNRAVRLGGTLMSVISAICVVFAERYVTQWVVFGIFISMALDMTGLPGPYSLLVKIPFAGIEPKLQSGPARQFANFCGFFFAGVAWACLLGAKPSGARVMLTILGLATFCQGVFDFCAGCFVFGYMLKFNLVSSAIYRLHVNTRAATLYAWDKANLRTGKRYSPDPVTYPTKGLPPNPTDLRAKPYDADDKWQQFHLVKYCHVGLFMVPLSIMGLALPWAKLHETVGTSPFVWQTLAWTGISLFLIIGALFVAKCILYPNKVKKEWCHPISHNVFGIPFICLVVVSFLATKWHGVSSSGDLARGLFWMGSAPLNGIALYTVASWVALRRDREFVNPSWMLMPVGNLVVAVAARQVDEDYVEWGWYAFGLGCLLWLALWPITFLLSIDNHHSDPRRRNFYGVWVAPPAVAMIAYSNLNGLDSIDDLQRVLFYSSLAMAAVLGMCTWPLNFFLEGEFTLSSFGLGFPLDVLAAAAVTVYGYTPTDTMQLVSVTCVAVASLVNTVNILQLIAALRAGHVFTPEKKFSPMSFTKLTHEAFREALPMIEKLAAQVKPGGVGAPKLRELASAWKAVSTAHTVQCRYEEDVIFPTLEAYFPGQTRSISEARHELERLISVVRSGLDSLGGAEGAKSTAATAVIVDQLKANIRKFGTGIRKNMHDGEHFYSTPVIRKYLNVAIAKDLVRMSWHVTPNLEMSDFLRWVLSSLRTRGQRTKFLKTWAWAMPERAQLLGLMVYRVVDDVTWVELARDLPEIVPRGLPGYTRYY